MRQEAVGRHVEYVDATAVSRREAHGEEDRLVGAIIVEIHRERCAARIERISVLEEHATVLGGEYPVHAADVFRKGTDPA